MTVEGQASVDTSVNDALVAIGETPMDNPPPGPESAQVEEKPAAAPQWNGDEWKFSWNGKDIVPQSRDNLLQWANQGYNYSQRMGELNKTHAQRMADVEAKVQAAKELEQRYSPFASVNEYAEKNPDWWAHVQKSFEEREKGPELPPEVKIAMDRLAKLEEAEARREQEAVQARYDNEDKALDAEIGEIRKQFPNIDLSATDASGKTAELRVLEHCQTNGINSFRAGFRDYFHDQIVVQRQAENRQQAVKTQQTQAKAGLLGTTQAPTKELKPVNTKVSWQDESLSPRAILEELRTVNGG